MKDIFFDTLLDSLKLIPLLLVVYIGIELLEYKFGNKIRERIEKAGNAGPAVGAALGSIPQCGFSVITAALYAQRLVTIGTLIAVFIATSDEAIPIILSQPEKIKVILPLILAKVVLAIIAGYAIDFIFKKRNKATLDHIERFESGECHHDHDSILEEKACCGHSYPSKKFNPIEILTHPLLHTAKIFGFIFATSLIIALAFNRIGYVNIQNFLNINVLLQPFAAIILGLIPNCASSVIVTQLYLSGTIGFGAVISGLSVSGGLGLLVLIKENKDKRDTAKIILILVGISLVAGLLIQSLLNI